MVPEYEIIQDENGKWQVIWNCLESGELEKKSICICETEENAKLILSALYCQIAVDNFKSFLMMIGD